MALILISRHLEENLDDWLTEGLEDYLDDDYLVFDCPGMYTSLHVMLSVIYYDASVVESLGMQWKLFVRYITTKMLNY